MPWIIGNIMGKQADAGNKHFLFFSNHAVEAVKQMDPFLTPYPAKFKFLTITLTHFSYSNGTG